MKQKGPRSNAREGRCCTKLSTRCSLSWLDADRTKALEGIVNVVKEALEDMKETGETPPVALSEKKFSGELRLRMPPRLHQRLAIQAAEENTSINKLILKQLC